MRVIKPGTLRGYWARYRDAKAWLETWLVVAGGAAWRSLQDVRVAYPHAYAVAVRSGATVTVFNVKGNRYRLIVAIHYNRRDPKQGKLFIRDFLTHAEYSKDDWKERH